MRSHVICNCTHWVSLNSSLTNRDLSAAVLGKGVALGDTCGSGTTRVWKYCNDLDWNLDSGKILGNFVSKNYLMGLKLCLVRYSFNIILVYSTAATCRVHAAWNIYRVARVVYHHHQQRHVEASCDLVPQIWEQSRGAQRHVTGLHTDTSRTNCNIIPILIHNSMSISGRFKTLINIIIKALPINFSTHTRKRYKNNPSLYTLITLMLVDTLNDIDVC